MSTMIAAAAAATALTVAILQRRGLHASAAKKAAAPCKGEAEATQPSKEEPLPSLAGCVTEYRVMNPGWLVPYEDWLKTGNAPRQQPLPAIAELEAAPVPAFGTAMRQAWFNLGPEWAFLNHGSYGGTFKAVTATCDWLRARLDANPIQFCEEEVMSRMVEATTQLAQFIDADPTDIVFVANATTGANCVLLGFPLQRGDVILAFNYSYPAILSTAFNVCKRVGAHLVQIPITFPFDHNEKSYRAALAAYPTAKLAIVDHITSRPTVILPLKEIIEMCHAAGVKVFVDGAHAVGAIPLSMRELGADYYTSNLHKWLCTAKGVGFLWTSKPLQGNVHPPITSHGYGLGYLRDFVWQGSDDYSQYCSIPVALTAFRLVGIAAIREHNHKKVWDAVNILTKAWGTQALNAREYTAGMADVQVPAGRFVGTWPDAVKVATTLRHTYKVEVPVYAYQNKLYVRISAQMYSDLSEYARLAVAVLQIQQ